MSHSKPRFLLINDIHVADNNISEFITNWNEAIEVCENYGISDIIVGGDLFQSRVAQTLPVLLAVQEALHRTDVREISVHLFNGNHDKKDQEQNEGYCHLFKGMSGVFVYDSWGAFDLCDENNILCVLAYFPETGSFKYRLQEILNNCQVGTNKALLYCHAGIQGALKVPAVNDLPVNMFDAFDKVLVGHYHDRTKIKGTNIEYIGASRQHNFGEDEEKGYTIVFEDGSTKFIQNKANTRYKTFRTTFKDFPAFSDRIKVEYVNYPNYKLKVQVECTETESSQLSKELIDLGIIHKQEILRADAREIEATSSKAFEKFDKNGLKDAYSDFCKIKKVEDVSTGIKYLNKISSPCGK